MKRPVDAELFVAFVGVVGDDAEGLRLREDEAAADSGVAPKRGVELFEDGCQLGGLGLGLEDDVVEQRAL